MGCIQGFIYLEFIGFVIFNSSIAPFLIGSLQLLMTKKIRKLISWNSTAFEFHLGLDFFPYTLYNQPKGGPAGTTNK